MASGGLAERGNETQTGFWQTGLLADGWGRVVSRVGRPGSRGEGLRERKRPRMTGWGQSSVHVAQRRSAGPAQRAAGARARGIPAPSAASPGASAPRAVAWRLCGRHKGAPRRALRCPPAKAPGAPAPAPCRGGVPGGGLTRSCQWGLGHPASGLLKRPEQSNPIPDHPSAP